MKARSWVRVAAVVSLASLAGIMLFGAASPAPASGPAATGEMHVVPGLGAVTYAHNAAYTATFVNTGSRALKLVTFRNPIPETVAGEGTSNAVFQHATCAGSLTATEFVCDPVDRVRPGESLTVTVVWKVPAAGASSDCPAVSPQCMTSSASWTYNPGSETIHLGPVATELLAEDDPDRVAGYPLVPCSDPSNPTVFTYPTLGPGNPLATSICAAIPAGGLAVAIEESDKAPSDPGVAPQVSEICMPAPGSDCSGTPFVFSSQATFTFVLANSSLPANETIDKVYHDGALVSTRPRDDPHVVSIKNQKFKGITTVVVKSSTNGSWAFG